MIEYTRFIMILYGLNDKNLMGFEAWVLLLKKLQFIVIQLKYEVQKIIIIWLERNGMFDHYLRYFYFEHINYVCIKILFLFLLFYIILIIVFFCPIISSLFITASYLFFGIFNFNFNYFLLVQTLIHFFLKIIFSVLLIIFSGFYMYKYYRIY